MIIQAIYDKYNTRRMQNRIPHILMLGHNTYFELATDTVWSGYVKYSGKDMLVPMFNGMEVRRCNRPNYLGLLCKKQ